MVAASATIKIYGWKRLALKATVENASRKLKTSTLATKMEENATVPFDKLEVPAGVMIIDI